MVERSSLRALVVDDNEDGAASLSLLIEVLGHQAVACHSASQALDCVREHRPDVVFCDIGMPKVDGYEFAQSVRAEPGISQPYLAAVTAWGEQIHRARSREAGFNAHYTKPLALADIKRIIDDARRWLLGDRSTL